MKGRGRRNKPLAEHLSTTGLYKYTDGLGIEGEAEEREGTVRTDQLAFLSRRADLD
jgi:hypothetical protein